MVNEQELKMEEAAKNILKRYDIPKDAIDEIIELIYNAYKIGVNEIKYKDIFHTNFGDMKK